jgi:hypothetical protein
MSTDNDPTPGPDDPVPTRPECEQLRDAVEAYLAHEPPDPSYKHVTQAFAAILDNGEHSLSTLSDAAATEAVTGISLNDATDMAMDALPTDVVAEEISAQLLGRRYRLTGRV